ADIIDHGVNGFLVPDGDVDALAAAIRHFLSMPDDEVEKMRQRAIERAADFSESAIGRALWRAWAEQSFAPIVRLEELRARRRHAEVTAAGIQLDVDISGLGSFVPDSEYVSWKSRSGCFYGRVAARFRNGALTATLPTARFAER